jgi:hypothetical protein
MVFERDERLCEEKSWRRRRNVKQMHVAHIFRLSMTRLIVGKLVILHVFLSFPPTHIPPSFPSSLSSSHLSAFPTRDIFQIPRSHPPYHHHLPKKKTQKWSRAQPATYRLSRTRTRTRTKTKQRRRRIPQVKLVEKFKGRIGKGPRRTRIRKKEKEKEKERPG